MDLMNARHRTTPTFALLQNLVNAAKWHQEHCHEECAVSLHLLKELAMDMVDELFPASEKYDSIASQIKQLDAR